MWRWRPQAATDLSTSRWKFPSLNMPLPFHFNTKKRDYCTSSQSINNVFPTFHFALACSTCRLPHSGANNNSIPRQPMLVSHCSTRFLVRRSPAYSSSSFPRNVWSACTRLANASCYSLADTLLDRQREIIRRHHQPH